MHAVGALFRARLSRPSHPDVSLPIRGLLQGSPHQNSKPPSRGAFLLLASLRSSTWVYGLGFRVLGFWGFGV